MFLSEDSPVMKTLERIRFSSNQNIEEGESNFDDEYVDNSVQLIRVSSFGNDLLQNLYFSKYLKNFTYRFNPHWSSNYCFDRYSDTAHDVSIFQGFYQRGIGFILHCQRQYLSIKTLAFFYVFNKLLKSLSKLQRYF